MPRAKPTIFAKNGKAEVLIPDEGVNLDGLNIVELFEGLLDLALVGLDVDDEDKGVVFLDLLHGALGVKGVEDDLVRVETGAMGDRLAGILGRPGELKGLGAVEGSRGADLASLVRLYSSQTLVLPILQFNIETAILLA